MAMANNKNDFLNEAFRIYINMGCSKKQAEKLALKEWNIYEKTPQYKDIQGRLR